MIDSRISLKAESRCSQMKIPSPPVQSLDSRLNFDFAKDLARVNQFLDNVETRVTFWGTRVIQMQAGKEFFKGSVPLDAIAERIFSAAAKRCQMDDLTLAERVQGLEILQKLFDLYDKSNAQIQNTNNLSRSMNRLRELSILPYTLDFYPSEMARPCFLGYSDARFLKEFGGTLESLHSWSNYHPDASGFFGPPPRVIAKEESVKKKLQQQRRFEFILHPLRALTQAHSKTVP